MFWIVSKISNSYATGTWPTVEKLSEWAQIIIAYTAVFAIVQYAVAKEERDDAKTKAVLDFVKFFREVVLESAGKIRREAKSKNYSLPALKVSENSHRLMFTIQDYHQKIFGNQKLVLEEYGKILNSDTNFEDTILFCLNALEEFSIGILNSNAQNHRAVTSIRKPFIEMVELLAIPLYFRIAIFEDSFVYLSDLYAQWKEKIGFVPQTKEDREKRFSERRAQFRKTSK